MRRTDAALDAIARRTAVALSMAGVQPRRSGTSVLLGPGRNAPATIPLSGVRVTEPASRPTERGRRNTAGADAPASRSILHKRARIGSAVATGLFAAPRGYSMSGAGPPRRICSRSIGARKFT